MNNFISSIQVPKEIYFTKEYNSRGRWVNYWMQIKNIFAVCDKDKCDVLEIGIGNGTVAAVLKKIGFRIKTLDIDPSLGPDIVGSVTDIPSPDNSFDAILAAEILEHLPFELFEKTLKEMRRVSKKYAVLSLPHMGVVFKINFKAPLIPEILLFFKVPYFWKEHHFNGQHYWEIGKKNYPLKKIKKIISECGWKIMDQKIDPNDASHWHCILKKNE
jgi:SAM-dependent methyltransferase